ncbi:hypothetical protein B0H13DRAFT_2312079 [Mycena leptocephala]|nr:hypothetical protein B0H13DRAFT_2312079 [Mycena leptocephala]
MFFNRFRLLYLDLYKENKRLEPYVSHSPLYDPNARSQTLATRPPHSKQRRHLLPKVRCLLLLLPLLFFLSFFHLYEPFGTSAPARRMLRGQRLQALYLTLTYIRYCFGILGSTTTLTRRTTLPARLCHCYSSVLQACTSVAAFTEREDHHGSAHGVIAATAFHNRAQTCVDAPGRRFGVHHRLPRCLGRVGWDVLPCDPMHALEHAGRRGGTGGERQRAALVRELLAVACDVGVAKGTRSWELWRLDMRGLAIPSDATQQMAEKIKEKRRSKD